MNLAEWIKAAEFYKRAHREKKCRQAFTHTNHAKADQIHSKPQAMTSGKVEKGPADSVGGTKEGVECLQCGKQGHTQRYCPVLIGTIKLEGASCLRCATKENGCVLHNTGCGMGLAVSPWLSKKSAYTGKIQTFSKADGTRRKYRELWS